MAKDKIIIKGAKENNLKNISIELPRDKFIVFTGLSGSGKSSLAFDTIYADGQRRYVESLSSYARQFLGQMEKPNVEYIEGLSPAISIDQKTTSKNPRSTVGTITEIYDYLRLLYSRVGIAHCPVCNKEIKSQTIDKMVEKILKLPENTKIQVLAPVVKQRKGEHKKELENATKSGFVRVRVDGLTYDLSEEINIEKNKKHSIEIVVDRLVIKDGVKSRLSDSFETALSISSGVLIVNIVDGEDIVFSQNYACPDHDISIAELAPRMFSFNSPMGACDKCTGLGTFMEVDEDFIIPDKNKSVSENAIKASGWGYGDSSTISNMYYDGLAKHYKFSVDTKIKDLDKNIVNILLYGTNGEKIKLKRETQGSKSYYESEFEGVISNLERRFKETSSSYVRDEISSVMSSVICQSCDGNRLKKEFLAVTIGDIDIMTFCRMPVDKALNFINNLKLTKKESIIAKDILKEIKDRLSFLNNVGLSYLSLYRAASTLSGGENQRIRLATQIGSSLVGVIYILDEPSIGLHQKDNDKLIETLKKLRDLGNTLIVVEHDEDTMYNCDYIVDIGPYAGVHGGEIVVAGTVEEIKRCDKSLTGQYLSGKRKIEIPKTRRKSNGNFLEIKKASENNLKNVNVKIPMGVLTCVTGVSGSGKSSLVNQVIYNSLMKEIYNSKPKPGKCEEIKGLENIDKVIGIDQSPIGKTPRSNPATYTGVFTDIRDIFAMTSDAKAKGYGVGRFSFNVKGGRCEACSGDGIIKIEMHFLPDVYVPCDICQGKRYNSETLEIKYKNKNIHDILEMTIEDASKYFENVPKIKRKLDTLIDVGLGYIKVGQPATTLSGGEAQRVKLATELSKKPTGKTVYILDEPSTGLHMYDVHKLTTVLDQLVENKNTVIVIEHNLDIIKMADYIIDLGPDGGDKGGEIVAEGTPEEVCKVNESYTGKYLKDYLNKK
ncbi:MAG: excinuclease ABC subunit UvrA [Oscillospiraceae bacterium]